MNGGKDSAKDQLGNKIMSIMLFNCYDVISHTLSKQLIEKLKNIDVFEPKYKELLGLEKFYRLYKDGNNEDIENEMNRLQVAIDDIQKNKLFDDYSNPELDAEREYKKQKIAEAKAQAIENKKQFEKMKKEKESKSKNKEWIDYGKISILDTVDTYFEKLLGVKFGDLDSFSQNLVILMLLLISLLIFMQIFKFCMKLCPTKTKKKKK